MPDVDAEWARFEREVIGKERPKRRLVAAWAAGIGIAAAIALVFVLNKDKEESADLPVMAQQAKEQRMVAQLTDEQPVPSHAGKPVAHPEPTSQQAKNIPATPNPEENNVYDNEEIPPRYPGGDKALMEFINENLHYPDLALEYGAKGRVIIGFIVDSVGVVSNFKVLKCFLRCDTLRLYQESRTRQEEISRLIDEQMREEALRVMSLLRQQPRWSPGELLGRPVSVRMNLPVRFLPTEQMRTANESRKHLQGRIAGQEIVPSSAGLGAGHSMRLAGSDTTRRSDSVLVILNGTIQSVSVRSELVVSPYVYIYKQHQMIDSMIVYKGEDARKRFEATYGFPPPRLGFMEITTIPDTLSEAYMQQHPEKMSTRRRIEGFVQREDGLPLADAWVSCDTWEMGAATDNTGHFVMWAPRTITQLNVQHVGYHRKIRNIQPTDSILVIRLEDATKLREVKVRAKGEKL